MVRDGSHLSEENSLEVVRQQHTFLKVLLLRIFFYIDVTLKRFLFFFFLYAVYFKEDGCLESEEQQEGHHQTEQTHGFGQGESQDSVREQLLLERWVSGVADDEGTEYCSDTGTRSSDTDGGGTSTDELRGRIDITADLGSLE